MPKETITPDTKKEFCPLCKKEIKEVRTGGFGSEPKKKCGCKPAPWENSIGLGGWKA